MMMLKLECRVPYGQVVQLAFGKVMLLSGTMSLTFDSLEGCLSFFVYSIVQYNMYIALRRATTNGYEKRMQC
jgi:hypothetical protein